MICVIVITFGLAHNDSAGVIIIFSQNLFTERFQNENLAVVMAHTWVKLHAAAASLSSNGLKSSLWPPAFQLSLLP